MASRTYCAGRAAAIRFAHKAGGAYSVRADRTAFIVRDNAASMLIAQRNRSGMLIFVFTRCAREQKWHIPKQAVRQNWAGIRRAGGSA